MSKIRNVALATAVALAVGSCVSPDTGAAARSETAPRSSLTSLPPATAPSTTTTTTTLGVPPPPDTGDGTLCDIYTAEIAAGEPVGNEAIVEASGIAASQANPGVYWVHNDSGHGSIIYAVGEDGTDLGAIPIEGVLGFDWEDVAVGPGPVENLSYLYVGDIGDNLRLRSTISLLRFPEPDIADLPAAITEVDTLRLTFPDGAEDAEAMWVDPITGDIFVVTKRQKNGKAVVLRADAKRVVAREPTPMTPVADFRFPEGVFVTAADVTSDGAVVAFRGYEEVWMWVRSDLGYQETFAAEPCMAPSPEETQGEAIAFLPGSLSYVTISEGKEKGINLVAAP